MHRCNISQIAERYAAARRIHMRPEYAYQQLVLTVPGFESCIDSESVELSCLGVR